MMHLSMLGNSSSKQGPSLYSSSWRLVGSLIIESCKDAACGYKLSLTVFDCSILTNSA